MIIKIINISNSYRISLPDFFSLNKERIHIITWNQIGKPTSIYDMENPDHINVNVTRSNCTTLHLANMIKWLVYRNDVLVCRFIDYTESATIMGSSRTRGS